MQGSPCLGRDPAWKFDRRRKSLFRPFLPQRSPRHSSEHGPVIGSERRSRPALARIIVEEACELEQAVERPGIALERLFAQQHQGPFLGRYLSRAAALLHLDRHLQRPLHIGREVAHAFAAPGRIARPASPEAGVLWGFAIANLIAITESLSRCIWGLIVGLHR
jgi:hypothetical protein